MTAPYYLSYVKEENAERFNSLDIESLAANPIPFETAEKIFTPRILCYALIYRFEGNLDKSRKLFRILSNIQYPKLTFSMNADDYEITPGPFINSIRDAQIFSLLENITDFMLHQIQEAIYFFFCISPCP